MASWSELRIIVGLEKCKKATTVEEVVGVINDYKLSWEMVPTVWQKEVRVWEALIPNMPLMAMLRHLGKFSSIGMLGRSTPELAYVVKQLTDKEYIHKSRLHPMSILVASTTYAQGHGVKGSLTWSPNRYLMDAMDSAFELAFANVEPSGKRLLVGIDVSGSMGWGTCGSSIITARTAAAAMAMITVRTEPRVGVMAFSHQFEKFPISDTESLNSIVSRMEGMNYGNTDCALPMIYATRNKMDIDGFVVITDNETWSGSVHPRVALANYRKQLNPEARSVVMGMTATDFSVADPNDRLSLDVVGLDTSTPQVVSDFIAGRI
jgi:60 kDa SS-A/Ro ribonucleoprotein